jgi:hypothetical protein
MIAPAGALTIVLIVAALAFAAMGLFMRNIAGEMGHMANDINRFAQPQRLMPFALKLGLAQSPYKEKARQRRSAHYFMG